MTEPSVSLRHAVRWLGIAGVTLAIVAPGCAGKNQPPADRSDEWKTQGRVAKKMRTVTLRPEMREKGEKLFATCAGCHGKKGEGIIGVGPALNSKSFLAAASDDMLIRTIARGRKGTTMVPWEPTYQRQQIWSLVAYIRSWGKVEPAKLDEKPIAGDPDRGGKLFRDICSGCHGRSGAGYQETANGTGIGRWVFLSEVSNGYLRHIIKHGKTGTKMKSFATDSKIAVANLTDQQIEDVIAYLRKQAW